MKKIKKIVLIFFIFLMFSCQKETKDIDKNEYMGYNYFPSSIGHELIYEVDSVYYDDFDLIEKEKYFHFYIKEIIESYFIDNAGMQNMRIERYKRNNPEDDWIIKDVWTSVLKNTTAERFEEDQRFIKLIFPIKEGGFWNGNAYNSLDDQFYYYTDVFSDFVVKENLFKDAIVVSQSNDTSLIHRNIVQEVYAPEVGMISKSYNVVSKAVNGDIISGSVYEYKLLSYKNISIN